MHKLRIILILLTFIMKGCSSFKIIEEKNPDPSTERLIYTEKIIIKEQIPFDLSDLFVRFLYLKENNEDVYLIGCYYTGPQSFLTQKVSIEIDTIQLEFITQKRGESEDLGLLGVAETIYIKIDEEFFTSIDNSANVKITIIGRNNSFEKNINQRELKGLIKFYNESRN